MTRDIAKRWAGYARKMTVTAVTAVILALAAVLPALALDTNDIGFHAGFQDGLKADIAKGKAEPVEVIGKPEIVEGRGGGKALRLVNGVDAVGFAAAGNLNAKEGAISFWLSAENWDGSMSDALQLFLHTNGGNAEQQLVLQTLWPRRRLTSILYDQGKVVGGFPEGVCSCAAPFGRANDAMSILRKGEWYHYLVTWRDGAIAIYFNGAQAAERLSGGIAARDLGDTLYLGWKKESGKLFIDPGCDDKALPLAAKPWVSLLADVTVFNTFLLPNQVEKIHAEGAVAYAARGEAAVLALNGEFYQTRSELAVTLLAPGRAEKQGEIVISDAAGKPVKRQPFALKPEESQLALDIAMPELPLGTYTVKAVYGDKRETTPITFEKVRPEWLGNQLGAENVVLRPWTPVKVEKLAGGRTTVTVWNRVYTFGNSPLPVSIVSAGQELLARPVELAGVTSATWEATTVEAPTPTRAIVRSRGTVAGYAVEGVSTLEYDGFLWCDLKFTAPAAKTVESLRLDMELPAAIAKFLHYPCRRDVTWPKAKEPWSGAFGQDSWYLYAMNERVGLHWAAESDQWWHATDAGKQMEVSATKDGGLMRINFVRDAIEMPKTFTLGFSLMATPVRPRPENWRGMGNANPYRRGHPERYTPFGLDYGPWSVAPGWVKVTPDREKELKPWDPKKPTGWLPFTSGCFYGLHPFGAKDINVWFPEWRQFDAEWSRMTSPHRNDADAFWSEGMCQPSPSFIEHYAWDVENFLKKSNARGFYFDGYPGEYASANLKMGFGYRGRDGKTRPTMPLRAGREMMRRVYALLQKHRGDDGILLMHPAMSLGIPILSFSQAIYDGEFLMWGDLNEAMVKKGPTATLTVDRLQTVLNYRQSGHVFLLDSRATSGHTKNLGQARRVMAEFLLHDIQAWGNINGYNPDFEHPLDWFGLADPAIEYIGYWDAAPAVVVDGGRVSAYVNRRTGKVLLVCTNDGPWGRAPENFGAPGKTAPQWYHAKLNLKRLGLQKGKFKAFDAESLGSLPVEIIGDGDTMTLYMTPCSDAGSVRLVYLEAVK
jgi:hypothetical protein